MDARPDAGPDDGRPLRPSTATATPSPRRSAGCATSPPCASPTTRCSSGSCRCTTPSCRPTTSTTASSTTSTPSPSPTSPSARVRAPGAVAWSASLSPDRDRDGWQSQHSVLLVVTDDMPFLVDTMRMVLERRGLRRPPARAPDAAGRPRRRTTGSSTWRPDSRRRRRARSRRGRRSRSTAPTRRRRRRVEADILRAVDDVQRVVDDFAGDARPDGGARRRRPDPAVAGRRPVRVPRRRRLRRRRRRRADAARRAASSASARDDRRVGDPPPDAGRPTRRRSPAPTTRPTVFRDERQTVVAVDAAGRARPAPLRRAAGDERLPRQRARHPRRRRRRGRCPRPRPGADARPHRTGDAHRAREPAPRARARAGADGAGPARRRHRRAPGAPAGAGLRGARAGRAVGHGARVPAPRPLHGRAARARRRRRRRTPTAPTERTFESDLGASSLARITVSVRCPAEPAAGRPRRARAGRSTSCRRRGRTGCGRRSSPTSARRAGTRAVRSRRRRTPRRRTAPPCRRSGRSATSAASPSCSPATTSWPRRSAATSTRRPGEWRFRVYRRGAPAALSELLPLLDHLGAAGPRRASRTRSALGDERVYRLRHRRPRRRPTSSSTSTARAGLQEAFAALVAGAIESDGFNRLVLRAGLSAREVTHRAGVRQVPAPDRVRLQPALHRGHAGRPPAGSSPTSWRCSTPASTRRGSTALAGRPATRPQRRGPPADRSARSTPSRASTTTASAGSFLTLDRRHRAHELLPRPAGRVAFKLDPAAIPELPLPRPTPRDLGVRAAGRGRPPARRRRSPAAGCAGATAGRTSAPRCSG